MSKANVKAQEIEKYIYSYVDKGHFMMGGETLKDGLFKKIHNLLKPQYSNTDEDELQHEFCPRCEANLTLQKGYDNSLPYWVCKGCGEMLINPEFEAENDIIWRCDGCGALLNIQQGFHEDCNEWICEECGYSNKMGESEIYISEDDYKMARHNPYKGLSDEEVLELFCYEDIENIDNREDIILVSDRDNGKKYIKKLLRSYNKSVYEYLIDHPIPHMPKIINIYEGDNFLIVIEEYISGRTLEAIIDEEPLTKKQAIDITISLCQILDNIHSLPTPIIHRDVKPSNIMITPENEVVLLDMNVAKWYDAEKTDDTRYMGTQFYAAPEQVGYGFFASSVKSDIYAVGILLNVMITGHFPKEKKAPEPIWSIIDKCICLEANDRYTDRELLAALRSL